MDTLSHLMKISKNEKLFNGLYHAASARFQLPEASMWLLYFLIFSDEEITQQDVAERMMLSKQTVNSAAANLVEKGYVVLERIPGTKRKKLLLTEAGRALTDDTVRRVLAAECRAVERLGEEKIAKYIELYGEFYECMRQEFQNEGITDA